MIVHAEINQEGRLETPLPKQFRGKQVVLSVVSQDKVQRSNWQAIKKALQDVDASAHKNQHIDDILADLRIMRESN